LHLSGGPLFVYDPNMLMSIDVTPKRRGRPAGRTFSDTVQLRIEPQMAQAIDEWRRQEPDLPSRSEAIRRLVEEALKAKR